MQIALNAGKEEEIDCESISRDLLDIPAGYQFLKFPLRVGETWSAQHVRPTVQGSAGSVFEPLYR